MNVYKNSNIKNRLKIIKYWNLWRIRKLINGLKLALIQIFFDLLAENWEKIQWNDFSIFLNESIA